jgi:hypothetical protein
VQHEQGLIAILDALGAATYSEEKIGQFLKSRELVLELLRRKVKAIGIDVNQVTMFTFNDTVLIVYRTKGTCSLKEVKAFGELLRRFAVNSLEHGILFRGAIAIGRFYMNEETNTVMGEAVSDAAAWYNLADWIGIAATPHATLYIQSLAEQKAENIGRLMIDYPVPLKNRASVILKAVNWPKAFFVKGISPCAKGENRRAKCLALLVGHGVPLNTEAKYFHTIDFFDHCAAEYGKERRMKKGTQRSDLR